MLASALHLLRGTPYIYMGEELGMMDPHYKSICRGFEWIPNVT